MLEKCTVAELKAKAAKKKIAKYSAMKKSQLVSAIRKVNAKKAGKK